MVVADRGVVNLGVVGMGVVLAQRPITLVLMIINS